MALAIKGEQEDKEYIQSLVDSINENLINVMRAMGAKVTVKKPVRTQMLDAEEPRPLNEVLTMLGGRGTIIQKEKRNG